MKRICHPEELRKALEAANLLQHIQNIFGEDQKQLDGGFLPICEPIIKSTADQAAIAAVNTVFDAQVARDWRTILNTDTVRLAAIDDSIKQDNIIAQIKAMTTAEFDAWWAANVTNAAQAIGVLKRVVRIMCRRSL